MVTSKLAFFASPMGKVPYNPNVWSLKKGPGKSTWMMPRAVDCGMNVVTIDYHPVTILITNLFVYK